jgi:2-polyprenyl-3-methyl-5-hydroxy-6-metoxy-1,4-benzoquinol methylase
LDIGCSTGHWLYQIKPFVKKVYGLELNKQHSDFVNKKLKFPCFNNEVKNYNVSDKFDVITFFQVFEHIPNPREFLMQIKKRLKKNGKLIIEIPNLDDPVLSMDDNDSYKDFYYRRPHEFYYNKKSLSYILNSVGLKGVVKGIHRYNYSNLLNWHINNQTQQSSSIAMAEFPIISHNKQFMKIVSNMEENYKTYLEKNLKSESIYFVGKFT